MKFTEDHEWVKVDGNNATIGITKYAVDELGEIVFIELPELETSFSQKDEFGTVESVKTVSSLYAPITGKVIEVNERLITNPELLNDSPEEDAWIIKINITNASEINHLMDLQEYKDYLDTI